MNDTAHTILMKMLKKKEEQSFIGAMSVNNPQKVNRDGVINESLIGGFKLPRHPLYKDYKGIVVHVGKKRKKKKRSSRKIYKKVEAEIKKRKKKGTRKQNEELKAWKSQENGLGKRIGKMEKNSKTSKKMGQVFSKKNKRSKKRVLYIYMLRKLKKKAPKYSNSILKDDYYKDKLIEHKDVLLSTVDSPKKSAFKMLKKPKKNKVSDLLWDIWATHHFVTLMEDLDNPARIMTGYNPDNLFNTDPNIESVIMEDELKDFGLRTKTHKQYPDAIDYDKLKKNKTKAIEWLKKNWKKEQDGKKEWLWVQKGGRRKTRKKRGGEAPVVGQIYQSKSEEDYPILQDGYKVTAVKDNHVWFNGVEEKPVFQQDDELIVTIAEFPGLFMSQQIQQPGGRKKKRKGRCTKKKRRRRR
jgi:hypothetical protein